MRVDSIIAINAHQQNAPKTVEYTGTSTGKTVSGIAFEEYLKANLAQQSTPTVARQTENHLAGLLMGYITSPKFTQREDSKPEKTAG